MDKHLGPLCKGQKEGGDIVQTCRTSMKRSVWRCKTVYRHSGPLSKGQKGVEPPCTDAQDLYLKIRGEVGDSVETLRTSI